jgi:serine/threonine protein kinase
VLAGEEGQMTNASSCPQREALEQFVLNQMSPECSRAFEEHLTDCEVCLGALEAACGLGPMLAALREPASREETVDEPVVSELIERVRRIAAAPTHRGLQDRQGIAAPTPRPTAGRQTPPAEQEPGEELQVPAPPQGPGEVGRLGPYRLLALLGKGGMGTVYLAEDPHLGRQVALKTLHRALAADPRARERFLREARAAAALEHDHIVTIFQVGEERGVPYLAMPLLKGESLEARLKAHPKLAPAEAVRIARETAEGLACAHAAGLIHRDIKPPNLWLEPAPRGRVKVLDFGLVRPTESREGLTDTGALLGTPGYMAPEQARGAALDGRVDLFSLGVVLYRMLTGRQPYQGSNMIAYIESLITERLQPPHVLEPAVPEALSNLVMRLLARNAEDRPASAAAVAAELAAIEKNLGAPSTLVIEPQGTRPAAGGQVVPPQPPPERGKRRRLIVVAVAAALLLSLAALTPFLSHHDRDTQPVPPVATRAPVVAKVKVVSMEVDHFAGPTIDPCGLLGIESYVTHFGDSVTVNARLSRPAPAFLISFRADGNEDLLFPDSEDTPPPEVDLPGYPSAPTDKGAKTYWLDDGDGLQVFAAVVLRQPMAYRPWKAQRAATPWKKQGTPPNIVWWDNGVEIFREAAHDRGKGQVPGAAPVVELRLWLLKAPEVEAVGLKGFAVLPKRKR